MMTGIATVDATRIRLVLYSELAIGKDFTYKKVKYRKKNAFHSYNMKYGITEHNLKEFGHNYIVEISVAVAD